MSSPSDSITDIDESGLNKKRGRAQSVEPTQPKESEEQTKETPDTAVSAPKKTKRDEDDNTSVNTIRRNMKDMTTTDKNSQDDTMNAIEENEDKPKDTLAQFGGNDDDWGEFAEEDDEEDEKEKKTEEETPKYTFGATSGFGTKGWAASNTISAKTAKPTFGGFSNTSGFGAFKTSHPSLSNSLSATTTSTPTTTSASITTTTTTATAATTVSASSFGAFAKATSSPFAAVAATSKDALSEEKETEENETKDSGFGEGAKLKVPNIKQTEVKTGEEDEDTIYQTKAKLLVLDQPSGNWKERGVGTFRINMKEDKDTVQTRLVMRTDSVFRLILNLLLFEGMKVFIMQDKFVRFAGFETETKEDGTVDTKLVSFALKLSNPTIAKEVCDQINDCIPTLK